MTGQGFTCALDIGLCIDVTGSMAPAIELVKDNAKRLHGDILEALAKKDREVTQLRLKVIAYRDVDFDACPFNVSDWFRLPDEESSFKDFVTSLEATGGGDEPESALDALSIAMRSDWTRDCDRQRHVIVLWTDATSKPPSGGATGSVPSQLVPLIAPSLDELYDTWHEEQGAGTLNAQAKRMVIFGPDCPDWNGLQTGWELVSHFASKAGSGLKDVDYGHIIEFLAASIA